MAPVLTTPEQSERTTPPTPVRTTARRSHGGERISSEVAIAVGVAWFVCYTIGSALEPDTMRPVPVIGVVLGVALLVGILATAAGLIVRRRWGLTASLASAGILVASSVACPTTGHHPIGGWWFGQMLCAGALVGISFVALRRSMTS
jgi:4-amino-4-deoxy-L-arabinose transferase-like glycosyltransferase